MLFYSCSSLTYFLTQWFPPIKRLSCFLYVEGLHDHSRKPVPCNNSNLIKFGIHEYYVGLLSYICLCVCLCKTESKTGIEKKHFSIQSCVYPIFFTFHWLVCRLNYNVQKYINTQLNDSAVARTGCCIDQSCDPQGSLQWLGFTVTDETKINCCVFILLSNENKSDPPPGAML